MDLSSYVQRLSTAVAARDKSALEDICIDLECTQLEREHWSQDVFDFFTDALQDSATCNVPGSSNFVISLYDDFDKLTKKQADSLLAVFDENAEDYGDEMLRHSVSDMVARKYPPEQAMQLFTRWKRSTSARRLHMAQVGFEILIMARRLDPGSEKVARSCLKKLLESQRGAG